MKVPQTQSRSAGARRAWAQPRFLLGAAAIAVMGATWASFAAPKLNLTTVKASVPMPHVAAGNKRASLADIPEMVAHYGEMNRLKAVTTSTVADGGRLTNAIGTGQTGFNLGENDLTSNTASDEREPVVSPTGDFIAFRSNGVDANNDQQIDSDTVGTYTHIWVMNRNGTGQRQVTGLNDFDRNRNQSHPSWSPEGNQLAYSDEDTADTPDENGGNQGGSQLWVVDANEFNAVPTQRTFFRPTFISNADGTTTRIPATVTSPAWAPSGLSIAFVTNYDGRQQTLDSARHLATLDIFSVAPRGTTSSLLRITGDSTDPVGDTVDDDHPSWAVNNADLLFFSSKRDTSGPLTNGGSRIWRIRGDGTLAPNQVSDPTKRTNGQASDADDYPAASTANTRFFTSTTSVVTREMISFQTNSFLDDTDQTDGGRDLNVWSFPFSSAAATNSGTPDETTRAAQVLTNILSSPQNFSDSKLTSPQGVDRVADREPSFSRTVSTSQTLARLVFASQRQYAPNTGSNGSTTPANPFTTHDIWTTSTQDTTPPALVAQGTGNLQVPVVAPQTDAPFFAPRTVEAGLKPGVTPSPEEQARITDTPRVADTYTRKGGLRFAVVLRDRESGFTEGAASDNTRSFVSVSFYSAGTLNPQQSNFTNLNPYAPPVNSYVNENQIVPLAREIKAPLATVNGQTSFRLNVYDDGPVSGGGHEQQANAVAGDGDYYCESLLPTPDAGDYYIDVTATDRIGNTFTYDNIWGISTVRFSHPVLTNDLFVSDYTCGQNFPFLLGTDRRFYNMPPVESYYLTNVGGLGGTVKETFSNVDIWRVLCRGPITQDILDIYRPTIIKQIDPTTPNPTSAPSATATPVSSGPTPTPTTTPLPYSQLTRNVAVAQNAVIWATPYAGTAFAGPGTITDPTIQSYLTSFLNDGGRFFISGRDVAWALSSGGTVDKNSFLNNELAASFTMGGEASTLLATDTGNGFREDPVGGDLNNLQFATRNVSTGDLNRWNDAAMDPNSPELATTVDSPVTYYGPGAYMVDFINATSPDGATVTPAYTSSGATVGQRIAKTRSNGVQSRAVYFSFGFESVNRRYRDFNADPRRRTNLNVRYSVASNILRYFKTASVSGTVINRDTGSGIPNFLVRLDGAGFTFFARTNAAGTYTISGVPDGVYTLSVYTDNNGLTSPQGFFGGSSVNNFFVRGGGGNVGGVDLTVIPTVPGAVIGRAVTSNGTFSDRTNDSPLPNISVLIRSVGPVLTANGIRRFARLTTTNSTGDFNFSAVPARAEMEVIFNPNTDDIPADANLSYSGPNPSYGRRILPDTTRPLNSIIIPSGDNFFLNDVGTVIVNGKSFTVTADNTNPDTQAEQQVPIIVPRGPTITGTVRLNGNALAGATVRLLDTNGSDVSGAQVLYSSGNGTSGTTSDGKFSFIDISPGTYTIRATIDNRDNVVLVRDETITLTRGNDLNRDVQFTIASITGRVVQSGTPVANATITLQTQNSDGTFSNFVPTRTTTTNSSGTYTLNNIPVAGYTPGAINGSKRTFTYTSSGGFINYEVFASLNSQTGSVTVPVRANDTSVRADDITLVNQQLSGTIQLQVDNNAITNQGGATVDLLNESGDVVATTTSASDGSYGLTVRTAGTYRVRSTYKGDVAISDPITPPAQTSSPGPTVLNRLRTISGRITDSTNGNAGSVGATVTVRTAAGVTLATTTSTTDGQYQTAPIAPGTNYTIAATKGSLSGSVVLKTLTRGAFPSATVNVSLTRQTTVTRNPTTFNRGMTYYVSFPYETSANATTRNVYDRAGSDATVLLTSAFNYGQTGTETINGKAQTVRYYTVQRFDPNSLTYVQVADNANLIRGQGYLVQVAAVPANDSPNKGVALRLLMPADNSNLKALTSGTTATTEKFTISLAWNASLTSNGLNGRNFIGFGLNPAKYGAVAWDTTNTITDPAKASVQVIDGTTKYTLYQAVQKNIISPTLTTVDSSTGRTVTATSVSAYGGYFVTARKAGLKLLFQFPQGNN